MPDGRNEGLQRIANRTAAGGVNTWVHPLDIQDDEAVKMQNITNSTPGQRQMRQGTTVCATGITAGPVLAISSFTPQDGNSEIVVVAPGLSGDDDHLRLYKWDGVAATFTMMGALTGYTGSDSGNTHLIPGYDLEAPTDGLGNEVMVISHNVGTATGAPRWAYDGSQLFTCHYGGTNDEPVGPIWNFAYNRGWGSGVQAFRNSLFYSLAFSWTVTIGFDEGAREFVFGEGNEQTIVSVNKFRGSSLIVFMSDRLESITAANNVKAATGVGQTTQEVISTEIGCGSRRSITTVGQDIYFADQFGNIRSLARTINDANQGVRSDPASKPIQGAIDRITSGQTSKIAASEFDGKLYVALPVDASTVPNEVWVLDVERATRSGGRFTWDGPWTGMNPNVMTRGTMTKSGAVAADQDPTLYIGQNVTTSGIVTRYPRNFADEGTTDIVYREETKRHSFNTLELLKDSKRLDVFMAATANVTMCVEANPQGEGWKLVGYLNAIGDAPALPQTLPFDFGGSGIAKKKFGLEDVTDEPSYVQDMQFRFTATASDEIKFLGYTYLSHVQNYEWDSDTP